MRNLKKILALVLALVMSLSLMATASAKQDFTDASSIDEKYATAVEVLNGLEVFKGYQNGSSYDFQPNGEITRAEVAAIIYRIATGDVKDEQVKIYADYNKFPDVPSTLWSAGYINYCANAEYVKGETNGKFNPEGKVTGYQALAMILRAIGYTANGGFTGPGWDLQTAAVGEARGITKNILKGTLNENATRQTVAEILFQAILVNMVNFDQRTGYYELGESLGYKIFKLEEIEGVVVANEYANLYGDNVLADGKTNLEVAKDDIRTLDLGTKITDIGERRALYTQNTSKVLTFTGAGLNTIKETGAAIEIDTAVKFKTASDMNLVSAGADTTQFFVNFGRTGNYTCDQRLEFRVTFTNALAMASFERYANGVDVSAVAARDNLDRTTTDDDWTVSIGLANNDNATTTKLNATTRDYEFADTDYPVTFKKIIRATNDISTDDLDVIYGIFGAADNVVGGSTSFWPKDYITGDVFVGTVSNNTAVTTREDEDLSNKISYKSFFETYINPETYDANWNASGNGQWVKFVDNDNDGNCDYAFLTRYSLDEVIGTYKNKAGDTVMDYYGFNDDDHSALRNPYTVRYMDGVDTVERNVAEGDIVLAAMIDNQILVSHAESVTAQATSYNWKADEITTADGSTYGQSHIGNATEMLQLLSTMTAKTNYEMFLDKFGYVRAYRTPGDTQYALVTEVYYNNNNNGATIRNWPMTIELVMPDDNGTAVSKEYSLANSSGNQIVGLNAWTFIRNAAQVSPLQNWLQPAISNLGVTRTGYGPVRYAPVLSDNANGTFWPNWLQQTRDVVRVGYNTALTQPSTEFDYGKQNYYLNAGSATPTVNQDNTFSFTNVVVANIDGDSATVNGAAQVALNENGQPIGPASNPNSYAVNYIQLDRTVNVAKGAATYTIGGNGAYKTANNYTVNATNDTEFYIVHNGGVKYVKGYANMPALTNKDNNIHAAYAVAKNTNKDNSGYPYWVADVIVYEVRSWNDLEKTSISLAYYTMNQQQASANGTLINTLNSKTDPAKVDLIPSGVTWDNTTWNSWGITGAWSGGWKGYGFYQLWNASAATDGVMSAAKIDYIDEKYNASGIYAGTVTREVATALRGGYLPVNMTGKLDDAGWLATEANISIAEGKVYSVTREREYPIDFYEANNLHYSNITSSQVKAGDQVIWVGGGTKGATVNSSSFIVDLGNTLTDVQLNNSVIANKTPTWLKNIYTDIINEQKTVTPATGYTVTVKNDALGISIEGKTNVQGAVSFDLTKAPFTTKATEAYTITAAAFDKNFKAGDADPLTLTPADGTTPLTKLEVTNVTKDVTIELTYTEIASSLAVTLTSMGTDVEVNYRVASSTTAYPTEQGKMVETDSPKTLAAHWGDTATLTWTGLNTLTYGLSGADASKFTISNNGNAWTVTGPVKAVNAIIITGSAATATTVFTSCNIPAAINGSWTYATSVYAGDSFTGTKVVTAPTLNANYTLNRVYWTELGSGAEHVMTLDASGNYVSNDPIGTAPVTIHADVTAEKVDVNVAIDTGTSAAGSTPARPSSMTGISWTASSDGTTSISSAGSLAGVTRDGTVTIAASAPIWVVTSDTGVGTPVRSADGYTVTIPNVTGTSVTLTLYGVDPATLA